MPTLRDPNRDAAYFSQQIAFVQRAIDKNLRIAYAFEPLEGRASKAHSLCRDCLQVLVMRYGRGDDLDSLKPAVMQWVLAREIFARAIASLPPDAQRLRAMWTKLGLADVYDGLTVMAFALALRLPQSDLTAVVAAVGHPGEDALLDWGARALSGSPAGVSTGSIMQLAYPKPYTGLLAVWQAPADARAAALADCAKVWKQKMRAIYWANSLKGAEGAYFGHWCFDLALAAIALNIDAAALRDNPCYPVDLVGHAKRRARGPGGNSA